jgi:hypothetical protein
MKYTDYQNEYPMATDYLNRVREADERVQWLRERAHESTMQKHKSSNEKHAETLMYMKGCDIIMLTKQT